MKEIAKSVLTWVIFLLLLPLAIYSQSDTYSKLLKIRACRESGDNVTSLKLLNEFLAGNSDYRFYLLRGEVFLSTGDLSSAEADFKAASILFKSSGTFGMARVYAEGQNAAKSLSFLEENLDSEFRVTERVIMADPSFNSIESTSEWRKFWSSDRYTEPELFLSEVQYLVGIGRVDDARDVVSETRDKILPGPEMAFSEALLNYSDKKYKEAIDLLTSKASSEIPEFVKDDLLAKSYMGIGNYYQAIALLTSMIDKEVPDAEVFVSRAVCYAGISDYPRSMADLDFFLTLYPDNDAVLNLAGAISTNSGDTNGALKYLNRNLEANPNSIEAYKSRGAIWASTRMWDYAVSDFSMILDLDPFDSEVWLNKGLSLLNLGKKEEACHDFRQSMRLGNRKASDYINKHCIR